MTRSGNNINTLLQNLGLFEVHKLLFSFAMTTKIQEVESELNREELDFFIKVKLSWTAKVTIQIWGDTDYPAASAVARPYFHEI